MKKKLIFNGFLALACLYSFISCGGDDDDNNGGNLNSNLSLNITGLADLGPDYVYEGWMIVEGEAVTTGTFTVDSEGALSPSSFTVDPTSLATATKFVLTIEPSADSDPAPSDTHILAGDFSGNSAILSIAAPEALGNDFSAAMGKFLLSTPSNGPLSDEKSGVWFIESFMPLTAGLDLPTLPTGWKYEGWAVIDGVPVSTGTFTEVDAADMFSGYSGSINTPSFPGEDFLMNAPDGLTFPTNLSGAKIVVSIEPSPDNSLTPFVLKPLLAELPSSASSGVSYTMDNIISTNAPAGLAER